jgi:broad specificity phosphatase PhoE
LPTTVLLIRHPESDWNQRGIYQGRKDIPLSPLGRAQAQLVAARLRDERLHGVICSPLQRARALAHAIADHHSLHPTPDERLTEISHGEWEGLSRDEVKTQFPDQYQTWLDRPHAVSFPGGESLQDVHTRSVPPIAQLLARPETGTWVVVTHDTVARLVLAAARQEPVVGFSSVSVENAGITTLVGPALIGSVRSVNDVAHLAGHRVNLDGQAL